MIECLAERSAFIRAQCECIEDRSTGRGLKIPDELGKRWVKAVMSTPASLRAADDSTIVEYLKVCSCAFVCDVGLLFTPQNQAKFCTTCIACTTVRTHLETPKRFTEYIFNTYILLAFLFCEKYTGFHYLSSLSVWHLALRLRHNRAKHLEL